MGDSLFDDIGNNFLRNDYNEIKFSSEYSDYNSLPELNIEDCISNQQFNKKKAKNKNIKLKDIKILKDSKKAEKSGIGVLRITGTGNKRANSVMQVVSDKFKNEMDVTAKELLQVRRYPYIKRKSILTDAEKKLYKVLVRRLPDKVVIFSKVRLADIVNINETVTRDSTAFRKIAYKHVDFVILSSNLDLICVVELDDFTHDTCTRMERDKFVEEVLRQCGIQIYRIKTKIDHLTNEDTKPIEMWTLQFLAPTCPMCGRPMEPKESKKSGNYGHRFYGCMGFYEHGDKQCKYTIDID